VVQCCKILKFVWRHLLFALPKTLRSSDYLFAHFFHSLAHFFVHSLNEQLKGIVQFSSIEGFSSAAHEL